MKVFSGEGFEKLVREKLEEIGTTVRKQAVNFCLRQHCPYENLTFSQILKEELVL